jgi:hypothetical protein
MEGRASNDPAERSDRPVSRGCLPALVVGFSLGLLAAAVLNKAWDDCGAPLQPAHPLLAAVYGFVIVLLAGATFFVLTAPRPIRGSRGAKVAAFVLAGLIAYWLLSGALPGAFQGALVANNGLGSCPGNVPPWWPSWLPI